MADNSDSFIAKSTIKAADVEHRRKINFNIGRYNAVVPQGKSQFADINLARERAKNLKWRAIETLDKQLETFETAITKRGAKVIWAEDADQAKEAILKICKEKMCRTIVKSKSMVTEEIHLNDFLQKNKIESVETDLGEYIQQLDGEPPYHIVTPAMHKSKEDVAKLFTDKLGTHPNLTPEQLTLVARDKLREKYALAEVGITGANFIIADIGAIAVTENEGNARLSCSMPKTHIVIAGIEKIIPSLTDLALFWPLLSTYGTGQRITVYNTIVTGPRQNSETDGPDDMYVILLDNGRTNILANEKTRESLYCIRCGACLNACPVYKNIGGHTYATAYSGPIGSVITPHLRDMHDWKHLSYASSLCGNCTEVCAVKINLHELLLENRHESVEKRTNDFTERIVWKMWKQSMLRRSWMDMVNGKTKSWFINKVAKSWTASRGDLDFPKKSFNEQWKKKMKDKAVNEKEKALILYAHSITPRLQYIVDLIGKELLVDTFKIITSPREFSTYTGAKINYTDERIAEKEIWIKPHGLLFENGIKPQSIECFEVNGNKAFFRTGGDLPFDIFAASFYLLGRYEEYLPHTKDMYGRYAFENSLAHKENFLNLPLINIWLKDLSIQLGKKFPGFTIHHSPFTFLPTYDIDIAWSYKHKDWWRNAGGFLRSLFKGEWSLVRERILVLQGKQKDPFDAYGWMNKLHERYKLKPYYFFLVPEKRGRYDKNISPSSRAMQELIHDHAIRYPVGVHPSWKSGDDIASLKKEIETLSKLNGSPVVSSRQHYIRFNLPGGYQRLIDNGIKYDFSMGYGSINGFRASVASPFYWYDLEKEKQTELMLFPFCYMEANSFYEQKKTAAEALEEMTQFYNAVKSVNGYFIMIWHNSFLGTDKLHKGWRDIYEQFIKEVNTNNANSTT